jgi:hypothetical protein
MKWGSVLALWLLTLSAGSALAVEPRVIEVIAASDNTFRVLHEKSPVIRAKPGEILRLRITSEPGSEISLSQGGASPP